jgi:hypothetical protein
MAEKTEPPAGRISSLFLVVVLITLILSVGALFWGVTQLISSPQSGAEYFILIGFIGLALFAYMLLQTRRKPLHVALEMPRVITTILCQKCGFKNIRDFQQGDYIFKGTEPCPKCKKKMMVSSIYREVDEKKKKRGLLR